MFTDWFIKKPQYIICEIKFIELGNLVLLQIYNKKY